jgi:hypothetical protein
MKTNVFILIALIISLSLMAKNPISIKLEKLNNDSTQYIKLKITLTNHSIWSFSSVDIFDDCNEKSPFVFPWVLHLRNDDLGVRLFRSPIFGYPSYFDIGPFGSTSKVVCIDLSEAVILDKNIDLEDYLIPQSSKYMEYIKVHPIKHVSKNDSIRMGHYSLSVSHNISGKNLRFVTSDTIHHYLAKYTK